jgi:hypothetical protein
MKSRKNNKSVNPIDDNYPTELLLEDLSIDFFKREYARRRIYKENIDNIDGLESAVEALKLCARALYDHVPGRIALNSRDFEAEILDSMQEGEIAEEHISQLQEALGNSFSNKVRCDLKAAYNFSKKYGYIISDMMMHESGVPRRDVLLSMLVLKQKC